jgi:flagellar L-ring protein precursor FlgH
LKFWRCLAVTGLVAAAGWMLAEERSPLDRYVEEVQGPNPNPAAAAGSTYSPEGPLADPARDPRASRVHDLVTILVVESANALAKGTTASSRKSSAKGGVSSLYGPASGRFADLLSTSNAATLQGEGATTRSSAVTTRLSARVTHVLPNGNLVVEGYREVMVNSERQLVSIRGVVRPVDLTRDNTVRSDRLAQMEVRINGKGVVNDAVRRPFFLYRLLLGLLPF